MSRKKFVDVMLGKVMSRKLLVWLTATGLLVSEKVDSEHWVWLALVYIGSQAAADIVAKVKGV